MSPRFTRGIDKNDVAATREDDMPSCSFMKNKVGSWRRPINAPAICGDQNDSSRRFVPMLKGIIEFGKRRIAFEMRSMAIPLEIANVE